MRVDGATLGESIVFLYILAGQDRLSGHDLGAWTDYTLRPRGLPFL